MSFYMHKKGGESLMELFKLLGTIAIDNSNANKAINSTTTTAKSSSKSISSSFRKIAVAVGTAFSVQKIKDFGEACVEAYKIQEQAELKLSTIMKQRMGASDESIDSIKDYASAQQKIGVVGDEVQLSGAQQLATFLKTDDALKTLIPAMNNLAVQQNGYNVTCENMVGIGNLMGKVMQGQTSALSRVGITFSDAQEQVLKYGTEQERAATLAQVITDNVGNMNEVMAKTDAGKIQQAKNNFGDLQEQIGKRLMPVLGALYSKFNDIVILLQSKVDPAFDAIGNLAKTGSEIYKKYNSIIKASTVAVGAFLVVMNWSSIMGAATTAIQAVAKGILTLNRAIAANPVKIFISLIASLISYVVYLYNTNEDFRNKMDEIWGSVKVYIEAFVNWFKENVVPVFSVLIDVISEVFGIIQPIISGFIDWFVGLFESSSEKTGGILETIKGFFVSAWEFIKSVWEAAQPFFDAIWDGIIAPVGEMLEELFGAFAEAWNVICLLWKKLTPFFTAIWNSIKVVYSVVASTLGNFFKTAWGIIKAVWDVAAPFFKTIWTAIKGIFSVVSSVIGGFFKTAWNVVKATWDVAISFFTSVFAGIKAVFAVVAAVLGGDFEGAWKAIKNAFSKVKEFFKSVWDGIKSVFGSVADWFKGVFSKAWQAVKDVFTAGGMIFKGIKEAIADVFKTVVNSIIRGINTVIAVPFNTINGMLNTIRDISFLDISPFKDLWDEDPLAVPQIPQLKKGGVLEKGQVGLLEGDGAEAVVPLENNKKWIRAVASDMKSIGNTESAEKLDRIIELLDLLINLLPTALADAVRELKFEISKREFARLVRQVN